MNIKKINVGIIGASGFTGSELCRLLLDHKHVGKIIPISRERKSFNRSHPNLAYSNLKYSTLNELPAKLKNLDCVFLCTKSGDSYNLAIKILKKNIKIIDLSSAFRFENASYFKKAYGQLQKKNSILSKKKIIYGLSEFNRKKILNADLIANPGCYAIAAILSLVPILKKNIVHLNQPININAVNGTTGAGNNPKIQVSHANTTENMLAYNAEGHRHAPEIEEKLKAISKKNCIIDLNTSHGNFRRGIHMRISLNVKSNLINKINRDKIIKIYEDFYYKKNNDFQFIQVLNTKRTLKKNEKDYDLYPSITNVIGTNNCLIGIDYDKSIGAIKIISTSDNLVKGAAGSAIQNMNIMFGFEENTALTKYGIF